MPSPGDCSPSESHPVGEPGGPEQLRRLALIQMVQRLGLGLDVAAAVLDEPSSSWRAVVQDQITALDGLIAGARGAQKFLTHGLGCPAEHPVRECEFLIDTLDRLADGMSFEQFAAGHR